MSKITDKTDIHWVKKRCSDVAKEHDFVKSKAFKSIIVKLAEEVYQLKADNKALREELNTAPKDDFNSRWGLPPDNN